MPPQQDTSVEARWQAEYEFWHKIIAEEVDRLRFNDGYEPLELELYPSLPSASSDFLGVTRIGRKAFCATGRWDYDSEGKKVLKIQIRPQP